MRIAIGADHRGFKLKEFIKQNLTDINWRDVGAYNDERSDYPDFTLKVCIEVLQNTVELGILICGTGIGMSIAANRFSHIYAGIAWNEEVAKRNKEDDNINVLILPADFVNPEQTLKIITSWLNAEFKGGRYKQRLMMIDSTHSDSSSSGNDNCCM